MNLIDWKGDLRMAFYKSSGKTILHLGEEKQRENTGVEPLSVCVWGQNPGRDGTVIHNCNFTKKSLSTLKPVGRAT